MKADETRLDTYLANKKKERLASDTPIATSDPQPLQKLL